MSQIVFSGKPSYANKKLTRLQGQGFKIIRSKHWADGSTTYVMEKKNDNG